MRKTATLVSAALLAALLAATSLHAADKPPTPADDPAANRPKSADTRTKASVPPNPASPTEPKPANAQQPGSSDPASPGAEQGPRSKSPRGPVPAQPQPGNDSRSAQPGQQPKPPQPPQAGQSPQPGQAAPQGAAAAGEMPQHGQQTGRAALGVAIGVDDQGEEGVRVTSVDPNSAAAKAGLRDGDRITAIDGKPIRSAQDLVGEVRRRQPGSNLKIAVVREGRQENLTATLTARPQQAQTQPAAPNLPGLASPPRPMLGQGGAWLGIMLEPSENGTRVLDVFPNGPAAQAGLRPGDTLVSIHQKRINSPDDARQSLEGLQPQQRVEIVVNRDGKENRLTATLGRPEQMAQFQGPTGAPGMAMPGQAGAEGDPLESLVRQVLKEVQDLRQEVRELRSQSGSPAASRPSTAPPSQR